MGKTKRDKGTKLMVGADRSVLPVTVHAAGAAPHEVTLVGAALEARFVEDKPERLIEERTGDAFEFDEQLTVVGGKLKPGKR